MDFQTAFNLLATAFGAVCGWLFNNLWTAMRDLAKADTDLTNKVQAIELLVAGQYVKRTEFEAKVDAMFHKLDSIESKIDRKLDSLKTQ